MSTKTVNSDGIKIERSFLDADRYVFDFKYCSYRKGWAQVDTQQDAWYYGQWLNPSTLEYVMYCEGDVTRAKADNPEAFAAYVRQAAEYSIRAGYGYNIDGMCDDTIIAAVATLGLGDLLH